MQVEAVAEHVAVKSPPLGSELYVNYIVARSKVPHYEIKFE